MKMKLMSAGDGVISRCEQVEISAPGLQVLLLGWFFGYKYRFEMSSDGPASTFCSPTLVPSESSFETIYICTIHTSKFLLLKFWRLYILEAP